jgi:multidrug transporter EmrE-like cation transporter
MNYGFLIIALVLNAGANILLKIAAIGEKGTTLRALMGNPYAVLGVIIFAANVYFYIQALRLFPVSVVYPILTAAGFILINGFGILFLKEPVSAMSIIGYLAIIIGIILVTVAYK